MFLFYFFSTGTLALRYAATQDMKVYINSVFNPDMADEQKDDNNDNDEAPAYSGNGVTEVES